MKTAYQHLASVGARVTALASSLVVVLALAVLATPTRVSAHNELGWGWCTGFYPVCVSTDANGYGGRYFLNTSQGFCRNVPVNDAISGVDSHSQVYTYFWEDAGCNGPRKTVGPEGQINNLSGTGWNDEFSSYCIGVSTSTSCGAYF